MDINYKGLNLDSYGLEIKGGITIGEKEFTKDMIKDVVLGWTFLCPLCAQQIGIDNSEQCIDGLICCAKGCYNMCASEIGLNSSKISI